MQSVHLRLPFLLLLVMLRLILVMRQIRELDRHTVIWPWASLADSMREVYVAGLRLYQGLMDQMGSAPWPWDWMQLSCNLARFVVHLAANRSLQVSTIHSYLARVHLELRGRGLGP